MSQSPFSPCIKWPSSCSSINALAGRLPGSTQPAGQAAFSLPLEGDQPLGIGGVDDEDGEQARRFGGARILADGVVRAGQLRPALTRAEHLRLAVIHPASDRARKYVAGDEGGMRMVMRPRCTAGWIVDNEADQALAGNVRDRLPEGRRGRLTVLRSRLGRREVKSGRDRGQRR